jgi:hypothetical protein
MQRCGVMGKEETVNLFEGSNFRRPFYGGYSRSTNKPFRLASMQSATDTPNRVISFNVRKLGENVIAQGFSPPKW